MSDLIERLNDAWRNLYRDGDEHDVCDTIAEAADALEAARADAEAMLDALRQIAEWPDGGERYGQEKIKRFAQAAIDAALAKENSND